MAFKSVTRYTQKSLRGIFFIPEDKDKAARETIQEQMSYDLALKASWEDHSSARMHAPPEQLWMWPKQNQLKTFRIRFFKKKKNGCVVLKHELCRWQCCATMSKRWACLQHEDMRKVPTLAGFSLVGYAEYHWTKKAGPWAFHIWLYSSTAGTADANFSVLQLCFVFFSWNVKWGV